MRSEPRKAGMYTLLIAFILIPLFGCNQEKIAKQVREVKKHIDKANEQLERLELIAQAFHEAGIGIEDERMKNVMDAIGIAKEAAEIGKEKLEQLDTATGSSLAVLGAGGGTLGSIIYGIGLLASIVTAFRKSRQAAKLTTELKDTTNGLDSVIRAVNETAGIGAKIKADAPLTTPAGLAIKARYDAVIPAS